MGEFKSGLWIIGLSLYFFCFFLIVFSTVNAAAKFEDVDVSGISYNDPGFYTAANDPLSQGGRCRGSGHRYCAKAAGDNFSCESIPGCQWLATFCSGLVIDSRGYDCVDVNDTLCELVGCTLTDFSAGGVPASIDPTAKFDWSTVKNTIGIMTGFSANIGMPGAFVFIYSFLFFWIELFALLWAIYMALPFLH